MEKKGAAKHSADYRARQEEKNARLGIEKMSVEVPAGTRSQMNRAMQEHEYSQVQELWMDLALSFLAAPLEEQKRRLRKPSASTFTVSPKLARQLRELGMKEPDPDADEE